jgi:hypothetical protein
LKRLPPFLLGLLLLAGCGGHHPAGAPEDAALAQAAHSGQQSLSFARPEQAVRQYQQAFTLALARNDAQAIGDCGFDLAVARLAGNDAAGALRAALRTRAALAARAVPGFAELDLVQAAALHRLGRDGNADLLAARAQATANDPATRAKASYVRGLIAAAHGDQAGIAAALAGFGQPKRPSPDWQADHDELSARLALLDGQYRQAALYAQQAADIHRAQLDYAEMADNLALAAQSMRPAGALREAADLYLQAGESAVARGDAASAVPWLQQVLMPGADPAAQQTARDSLRRLLRPAKIPRQGPGRPGAGAGAGAGAK